MEFFTELEVTLGVDGSQVNMGVGHFHAHNGHCYALAWYGLFHGLGHAACKEHQFGIVLLVEVEYVVDFFARDNQYVAGVTGLMSRKA